MEARKIRVYLIDDHDLIRIFLREALERDPEIEVVGEAESAEEGLSELTNVPTDVVVMDIGLPGMSGIQATRILKASRSDIAVLVLTGGEHDVNHILKTGANGYAMKTCSPGELIEGVKQAFEAVGSPGRR